MTDRPRSIDAEAGATPRVSVVVVNFNGRELLGPLFEGLRLQTYANHEVVLVDNASTDGSVEWARGRFPEVRVIAAPDNLGFTGGNNLGIRNSDGTYIVLLNNDTVPDPDCLTSLVAEAERDPTVGGVGAKILFFRPFLPVALSVPTFLPAATPGAPADSRTLGVLWDEATCFAGCSYRKPIFERGFYGPENYGPENGPEKGAGRTVRWSTGEASLLLPVEHSDRAAELALRVTGGPAPGRELRIRVGSADLGSLQLRSEFDEHRITVPRSVVESESFDVINNAGTRLDHNGQAGDRGIYEPDCGQYDNAEDLDAFCGAAALLRRSALEQVGLFDDDFFMYYEDTDLSWRLRRGGYRLRYQPAAVVRHLHATSSGEFSPLFNFYTARNKVLMIAKNAAFPTVARACGDELLVTFRLLSGWLRRPSDPHARQALRTRLQADRSLLWRLPRALSKRAA